jgi:hypothetical protein
MKCAEFEILLCDAVDGTLDAERRSALEVHQAECAACAQLAADVAGVTTFLERAATVEPPRELLTRILHETTGPAGERRTKAGGWWPEWMRRPFGALLQPRLAMGMAMTILSVSMLAQVFGLELRQFRASDLEPAKIYANMEDTAHRHWTRMVKYYENIKVVFEIQTRLKEWAEQEEIERQLKVKEATAAREQTAAPGQPGAREEEGAKSPASGQ